MPEMSDELRARYDRAMHRMQTGVAYKMEKSPKETEPKHLRVGINSAMDDHAALAAILIRKGVITEQEYYEAVVEFAEREAEMYEREINRLYGSDRIKLG